MAHPIDPYEVNNPPPAGSGDRSLGELFSALTHETTTLVRQEVTLAKTEMSHKAAAVGKDVGFLVAGGAITYAGLLALLATIIIALGQVGLTWWLSAFLVGVIVIAVGGFLVWRGLNQLKQDAMAPQETIQTLKEDAQWAKEQTK